MYKVGDGASQQTWSSAVQWWRVAGLNPEQKWVTLTVELNLQLNRRWEKCSWPTVIKGSWGPEPGSESREIFLVFLVLGEGQVRLFLFVAFFLASQSRNVVYRGWTVSSECSQCCWEMVSVSRGKSSGQAADSERGWGGQRCTFKFSFWKIKQTNWYIVQRHIL